MGRRLGLFLDGSRAANPHVLHGFDFYVADDVRQHGNGEGNAQCQHDTSYDSSTPLHG